jgi:hypothetical protein
MERDQRLPDRMALDASPPRRFRSPAVWPDQRKSADAHGLLARIARGLRRRAAAVQGRCARIPLRHPAPRARRVGAAGVFRGADHRRGRVQLPRPPALPG